MRVRSLVLGTLLSASALVLASACGSSNKKSSGSGGSTGSAGSSGASGVAGSGGATGGDDCSTVAAALCNRLKDCSPLAIQVTYGDVNTCITRATTSCKAATTAPGASVAPSQFTSCVTAFSKLDCKNFTRTNFVPSACLIPGSRVNGKACGSADQCQSGYCSASTGICGTCGQREASGKSCTTNDDCQSGLICNSKSVCSQPVSSGGNCTDFRDCAVGLNCASGKCATPLAEGKTCTNGGCDRLAGLFCNPQTKKCQAIKVADANKACGIVGSDFFECTTSGHCKLASGKLSGTCLAHAADGADCDAVNGPNCMPPALCVNKKCTLPDPSSCK